MKLILLTISFLILSSISTSAQIRKSEREVDGLKGQVKAVISKRADVVEISGKLVWSSGKLLEAITYDRNGDRLTWKTYENVSGTLFDSVVYDRSTGEKVANYLIVENPFKITTVNPHPTVQPQGNSNIQSKTILRYKYDRNGEVIEEAWHQSDGSLLMRYTYTFEKNQIVELVYDKNGKLNQKNVSLTDEVGNVVEKDFYDVEENEISSKEKYEYLVFGLEGNWTLRKTSEGKKEDKFVMKAREVVYRQLEHGSGS